MVEPIRTAKWRLPVKPGLQCPDCSGKLYLRAKPHQFKLRPNETPFKYVCENREKTGCRGSCGAHPDGMPTGLPAGPEVRKARGITHEMFDRVWNKDGRVMRNAAYAYIAEKMGIAVEDCHIGLMQLEELRVFYRHAAALTPSILKAWLLGRPARESKNKAGSKVG